RHLHHRPVLHTQLDARGTLSKEREFHHGFPSDQRHRAYDEKERSLGPKLSDEKHYFEDNMIEYVYGYLDLAKGQTYTLDNFNKDAAAPSDPVTVEYAFDDVWMLDTGGMLNCRVLHFTHGATTGYIWIDKKTRAMVKELGNSGKGNFCLTRI